jgi:uncharacterized protein (TIGR03382 family)
MRTILIATILAGCAWTADASAQAAASTWDFSYTGFNQTTTHDDFFAHHTVSTTVFAPDLTLTGSFSGADNNHDGVIELTELTGFTFNGLDYYACQRAPAPHQSCYVENFSYTLAGELAFSADANNWGAEVRNGIVSNGANSYVISGLNAYYVTYYGPEDDAKRYDWTRQTTFAISQVTSPAPEPASGAMAAAGAILLGVLGRRRRGLTGRA